MKATFKTKDPYEAKRLAKSVDMAMFILDLVNMDYDHQKELDKIHELLYRHGIIIDDLVE
jgi:hypothetical protein